MSDDLEAIASALGPDRLFIVCCGIRKHQLPAHLGECLVKVDGSYQQYFRCALVSLNVRIAGYLLRDTHSRGGLSRSYIDDSLRLWTNSAARRVDHTPRLSRSQTDAQVESWIETVLHSERKSYSATLRQFRNAGFACEQSRFRRLFDRASAGSGS